MFQLMNDFMGFPKPQQQEQRSVVEAQTAVRDLTIPLPGNRMAVLRAPVSLTTADHKFLTDYLKLMKDALIAGPETGENTDNG